MSKRPLRITMSRQSLSLLGIPYEFIDTTLNDFDTCKSKALKEVKSFCENYISDIDTMKDKVKGILFFGSNGVGKSMLTCIILKEAYRHRYSCRRITFSNYVRMYTKEEWNKIEDDLSYLSFRDSEFLALEEIGKEIDSKIATPILEELLRYRYEHGLVTIICTNLDTQSIAERYGESVFSLIKGCMTPIKIVNDDMRLKVFNSK